MGSTAVARREAQQGAVQEQDAPAGGIVALMTHEQVVERIKPLVPKGVDYETVVAEIRLAVKKEPFILKATGESIVQSVCRILQWGLQVGVTAYLVPFKNTKSGVYECTPIADYKGLAELVQATGVVRGVELHAVYDNDEFDYEYGLTPRLVHRPAAKSTRGKLKGAYAVVRLPFQNSQFLYMEVAEVDEIRRKFSKQWKDGECPPWYAKKTVLRQIVKTLPKNPKLTAALRTIQEDQEVEWIEQPAAPALPRADRDDDDRPMLSSGPAAEPTEDDLRYGEEDDELGLDDARPTAAPRTGIPD